MSRKVFSKKALLLGVVIAFCFCFLFFRETVYKVSAEEDTTYQKLKIFSDVLDIVQENYVEEVKPDELIYGAIKGMLNTLDPHSTFLPPDEYQELQMDTTGSFSGIGIEITVRDGILIVVSPIEDTPAYRVGLKAGDKIIKIEGQLTKSMTLRDAVKKIRGERGTKVTLTIMREGMTELKDYTIIRDIIPLISVKAKTIEPGYGYVRITNFRDNTDHDLETSLKELESQEVSLKGLILDLRNNPGGLLEQAVKVADEFLDSGLIVYTNGKQKDQGMKFLAKKNKNQHKYPLVVLVNEGSASASEIVAGALQDHKRGLILGTRTFGKGSVQTIIPLKDGSAVRLTTSQYYTPNGHSIQVNGVVPDIEVKASMYPEPQEIPKRHIIREEDLERHIEGEEISKEAEETSAEEIEKDVQLSSALHLLKSWEVFSEMRDI